MTCLGENYPKLSAFAKSSRNNEFVVVGAARGGWYAIQVLRQLGLHPRCISDMRPHENGQLLEIPIFTHEETFKKRQKTQVVMALLEPDAAKAAAKSITDEYDFVEAMFLMDEILHFFMIEIIGRPVDKRKYWESIAKYEAKEKDCVSVSPSVSYVMTEKCSLNCENCGAFVPDIDDPETFDFNSIVSDIKKYCSAFDVVHHIALQGGEPFMHKNIDKVVKEIAKIPNLLFIDIVTNGTINPKDVTMCEIKNNGAAIVMSDYGEHSPKKSSLMSNCERHNVFLDYHVYTERLWGAQFPIGKRNRSPRENIRTFTECVADKYLCCQIMNGQLHRCSFSNFTNRLKYIPDFKTDYVDMNTVPKDKLGSEIRRVALRKAPLSACDYCPGLDRDLVEAGVQIPKQKKQRTPLKLD